MATLSGSQVAELVRDGHLKIEPFDERLVEPASYDLRLGNKILASPISQDLLGEVVELTSSRPGYQVLPGQMVGVLSAERLGLPLDLIGRFGIRSTFTRRGVIAFGGLQLDPGFHGRLTMNLLNTGPEPIILQYNEPFFSVEFHRLERPAEVGYSGEYQLQDDFPSDQYEYILSARTTSLAEIPSLRKDVARLSVLIEELEERLPDIDQGLSVKEEVAEKLRSSRGMDRSDLLTFEQMRRKIES